MKKEPTAREIKSREKKQNIYETAISLFKEYGYDGITIKDIARESGMSEGSIYHFYSSKGGILLGMREKLQEKNSIMIEVTDDHLNDPVNTVIEYLLSFGRFFDRIGVDLASRFYMNVPVENKYIEMNDGKTAYKLEELRAFLVAAKEKGSIVSDLTPDELSSMMLTVCNGLVSTWISFKGSYSLVQESERIIPAVVSAFIRNAKQQQN